VSTFRTCGSALLLYPLFRLFFLLHESSAGPALRRRSWRWLLHFLPIVQHHLPSFFCWCTKVGSRDRLASWWRGEPRPLSATVWCLRSHTASIQLAQCTESSFAASRSGARPTGWRRDEAQARPHRLLVCALPSYTDATRPHLFSHRDSSALQVDE